jgi:hypothetical protein
MGNDHSASTRRRPSLVRSVALKQRKLASPPVSDAPQKPNRPLTTCKAAVEPNAIAAPVQEPSVCPRMERLLSCPDHEHYSEAELVAKLEKFFVPDRCENMTSSDRLLRKFDSKTGLAPKISMAEYLKRLTFYLSNIAQSERESGKDTAVHSDLAVRYLLASVIYLDRLRVKRSLQVTPINVHRLILTAILLSAKVLDDLQPGLQYFADLGGVSVVELREMEVAFLEAIDYDLMIEPKLFKTRYETLLESREAFSDFALEGFAIGA